MGEMTNLINNIWQYKIPEGWIPIGQVEDTFAFRVGLVIRYVDLPFEGEIAHWFESDKATEEDCAKVVERFVDNSDTGSGHTWYIDYCKTEVGYPFYEADTARASFASFASLLRSHNLTGNYLII